MSTNYNLFEERGEAESIRGPSAYQPNALPLGQTGSLWGVWMGLLIYSTVGRGKREATYHYTVTTGMYPAFRWAVMRAILMFH